MTKKLIEILIDKKYDIQGVIIDDNFIRVDGVSIASKENGLADISIEIKNVLVSISESRDPVDDIKYRLYVRSKRNITMNKKRKICIKDTPDPLPLPDGPVIKIG